MNRKRCRDTWTSTTVSPGQFTGRILGPSIMTVLVRCPDCGKEINSSGNFKTNIARIPPHTPPR